ncbi:MAG TPA: hypothetical protein VEF76_04755 [Patescibacteria group bacterium]|nr:hypothetical protein [Patescibacteria group bacterium]
MALISPADYRFDMGAEVALATRLYPRIAEEFFFVDVKEQNSHVNPEFTCLGAAYERNPEAAREAAKPYVIHALDISTSIAVRAPCGARFIVIYSRRMWQGASSRLAFTFDHEIGHQLVPSGYALDMAGRLMGESAADAFAALRALQRYGMEAGRKLLIRESTDRLTAPLRSHLKDDWEHLTGQVLNQIIRDCATKRFDAMSPDETVAEADHYATRFAPSLDHAKQQWALLNDIVDDEHIGNFGQEPQPAKK